MVPNVQEINLTNVRFDKKSDIRIYQYLHHFFDSIPSLQKVTWHHCDRDMCLNGFRFHPTYTKQIFSDDSLFTITKFYLKHMSNLEEHDGIFLFYFLKSCWNVYPFGMPNMLFKPMGLILLLVRMFHKMY